MRALKAVAVVFAAVLFLFACGGGGGQQGQQSPAQQVQGSDNALRQTLDLQLSSESYDDGSYRVLLHGKHARDLYQIAGSLRYDFALYEVIVVEAGGGLGQPDNSYFIDNIAEPGKLDFAYTRRWHGDGVNGDPLLMAVKVRPLGAFDLKDFRLEPQTDRFMLRDSDKQEIDFLVDGREAGNE